MRKLFVNYAFSMNDSRAGDGNTVIEWERIETVDDIRNMERYLKGALSYEGVELEKVVLKNFRRME